MPDSRNHTTPRGSDTDVAASDTGQAHDPANGHCGPLMAFAARASGGDPARNIGCRGSRTTIAQVGVSRSPALVPPTAAVARSHAFSCARCWRQ